MTIEALPRGDNPIRSEGITRGADGISRYDDLPQSLVHVLRQHAESTPDAEAIVEVGGSRISYADLWRRASRVAGGLKEAGVTSGDRAAILTPAGNDWVVAFFGCLLAGAVAVPINTRFAEPEVQYVLDDSGARFVFRAGEPLPDGEPYLAPDPQLDTLAAIFYTSGTTGAPKGALTTHEGFLSNCENMIRGLSLPADVGADLRTLISVPLFHVTGCNSQLLVTIYTGGTSVILPALDLGVLLETIPYERINFLVTVPAVYQLLIGHPQFVDTDTSPVRWIGYGGAPIAPDLVHRIKAAFPQAVVANGFGMTESASLMTTLPDRYAAEHADSVGFVVPVDDIALHEPDPDTGVGELLVKGPNVTASYWNKPEQTAAAFLDGWLRTGDLARVDPSGLVYIVDRAKDLINRGGENVYSFEVENALAAAPGIGEVAVVGVPDEVMGEKVGAVVVPAPGSAEDPAAIVAYLQGKIADFKIPQYIQYRREPLPRNPGGKVVKPALRAELGDKEKWGKPLR
ncbi:acyl-CoA synthetase (AMP-forming)/AMP-acid ligase II [Antricoccus suffuscus]|uniref:Acyl-CoA synthetase (AMP-forming)/AMP-acid ligase II n=1 Tax=Antricoccus suffuscus TaxID=1629062 RepID=A0A2T1A0L1_9ACTN|nr:AMP-binding protein [Antricoccus suffuscus]PRZ42142.1 acyl-CoA synthetase (AMP-forming)/AMP-acid ligase II [Antricoccus suffuscus]